MFIYFNPQNLNLGARSCPLAECLIKCYHWSHGLGLEPTTTSFRCRHSYQCATLSFLFPGSSSPSFFPYSWFAQINSWDSSSYSHEQLFSSIKSCYEVKKNTISRQKYKKKLFGTVFKKWWWYRGCFKLDNRGSEQSMFACVYVYAGHVRMRFDVFGSDIKERRNIRRQSSIRIKRVKSTWFRLQRKKLFPKALS